MKKTSTHWVTIPEHFLHTPADTGKKDKSAGPTVRYKAFWAVGLFVLALFMFGLLAPQQMANLLQGNLFDTTGMQQPAEEQLVEPLNIIPETALKPETPDVAAGPETAMEPEVPEATRVVEAQTEATLIEVEPVAAQQEKPAEAVVEAVQPAVTEEDASLKLVEELQKQLAEYQEKEEQNTQALQQLTEMVQSQTEESLHAAAPEAVQVTTAIGQSQMPASAGYRVNTHVAAITPQQALQQNMSGVQVQQTAQISANRIYRDQLGQAAGTPDSGPMEVFMIATILTLVGLWGWKFIKTLAGG
ncbi:hypothetical protein JXA05_04395 [Candidatus Peregrinibacteria bacterium]|nr:hypothetical protein [Candidatus Peregrinibacteria bacterium]